MPWLFAVSLWVLAVASLVTLAQRLHTVRSSPGAMDALPGTEPATAPDSGPSESSGT
jgi:hypothetical protein